MAEILLTRDEAEGGESGMGSGDKETTCGLCLKQFSKYTCPRCQTKYCSLDCYRSEKHAACSEGFYKDCFMQALQEDKSSQASQKSMLDILKRMRQQDGEDGPPESGASDLEERMAGVDLDDAPAVLERLTEKERRGFEAMLADGKMGALLDQWEPWWLGFDSKLIRELDPSPDLPPRPPSAVAASPCPQVLDKIPLVGEILTKAAPSESVKYTVVGLLLGYVYTARRHNGCHGDMPVRAAVDLMQVAPVLSKGAPNYRSCQEAVCHTVLGAERALQLPRGYSLAVLEDVMKIVAGPGPAQGQPALLYQLASLSDVHRLMAAARGSVAGDQPQLRSRLYLAKKKVLFLLAWCHQCGMGLRHSSVLYQLSLEHFRMKEELQEYEELESAVSQNYHKLSGNPLIQEI